MIAERLINAVLAGVFAAAFLAGVRLAAIAARDGLIPGALIAGGLACLSLACVVFFVMEVVDPAGLNRERARANRAGE